MKYAFITLAVLFGSFATVYFAVSVAVSVIIAIIEEAENG